MNVSKRLTTFWCHFNFSVR